MISPKAELSGDDAKNLVSRLADKIGFPQGTGKTTFLDIGN